MIRLTRYGRPGDPFGFLINNLFDSGAVDRTVPTARGMPVDVIESAERYTVRAELPGVRKEDVEVQIDGAQVTIGAEVTNGDAVAGKDRALLSERDFGRRSRSFTLPLEVDETSAQASLRDGVLELVLPKKALASRRSITIQ